MLSAAASIGMIVLWDMDEGLAKLDKYLYSNEEFVKVNVITSHDSKR